jgi:type IV secretory pathway VirB10-like protein
MRFAIERGQDISPVHLLLNAYFRPVSWPSPRLRFKPGQVVWVAVRPREWVRATVLETTWQLSSDWALEVCTNVAAYSVRVTRTPGDEDSGGRDIPIAHDSDMFIRKKRPPPPPAPGPSPEDARVASERREVHDRREAMERARELQNERQRKARAKEE